MTHSTFKISNGDDMCIHETEEVSCECHEIKEEIKNYFKTEEPQEMLDLIDTLGRKFKGVVVIIISTLGLEV